MDLKVLAARLVNLRAETLVKYPFFGRLLLRLPFGFSDCETAYTDMSRIVFDPKFAESLDDEQLSFVMLHELMHCVLKHCTRGGSRQQLIYNIACDIVVNSILLEAMNREEIAIGHSNAMHKTPSGMEGRLFSAEEVYEMLLKDKRIEELYFPFDCHDGWSELAGDGLSEELWDKYIKDSAKGVGKGTGIPCALERVIELVDRKPKISWKQVLHDYIQSCESDYLFAPPDKRFSDGSVILPSFCDSVYGSSIENIWFAVDTSGSVTDEAVAEAYGEIKDAIEQIENMQGIISFFDSEISEPQAFSTVEDLKSIKPIGGGGTSFEVIFEYMRKSMMEKLPKVVIIITDGIATFPNESVSLGVPTVWLLVNSTVTPPWGEILHVYTE